MDKCKLCGKPKDQHYSSVGLYCKPAADDPSPDAPRFVDAEPPCYECGGKGTIESGLACPTCWGRAMRGEDQPPVECEHPYSVDFCTECGTVLLGTELECVKRWVVLPADVWEAVTGVVVEWRAEAAKNDSSPDPEHQTVAMILEDCADELEQATKEGE